MAKEKNEKNLVVSNNYDMKNRFDLVILLWELICFLYLDYVISYEFVPFYCLD